MKAYWWTCVLGLLCMPAEAKVSQIPLSMSYKLVNSSVEITCSTPFSDPMGLYLVRNFTGGKEIFHLNIENGLVNKNTTASEFVGRIHITRREGDRFTLRLSLLGVDDTDLYYCKWNRFQSRTAKKESEFSNGIIIIVRENDPQEQCRNQTLDLMLICLSVTAFTVILVFFIGTVIFRCRRFKKHYRPARSNRPHHVCPAQRDSYLITSSLGFRGNSVMHQ